MNREHITSEQIWFILTVWETRSVTLAAQQLGVSTATATRQMTTLRTLLHDPLFLRGHDGLVPTARMSELVPKLKVLQEGLIDVVRRPVKFDPAEIKSTIRVAGVDNAIFAFLMPCLKDLYGVATGLHLSCVPLTENFPKHGIKRRFAFGCGPAVQAGPPPRMRLGTKKGGGTHPSPSFSRYQPGSLTARGERSSGPFPREGRT